MAMALLTSLSGRKPVAGGEGGDYVVFGHSATWTSPFAMSGINGTNGVEFDGISAGEYAGAAVATGDINGDGFADVFIGAPGHSSNAGATYMVFGRSGVWTTPFALSSLSGANGVEFDGASSNDQAGYALAAGDINGDGIADILIGAPYRTSSAGVAYAVFGHSGSWTSPFSLSSVNGSTGVEFDGQNINDYAGYGLAVGDVNGDGTVDALIGAYGRSSSATTYVYFGGKRLVIAGCFQRVIILPSPQHCRYILIPFILGDDGGGFAVPVGDVFLRPLASSSSTTFMLLFCAAMISAVLPPKSRSSIFAPFCSNTSAALA